MSTKVFCIGAQKTGTTSLKWALTKLDMKVGDVIGELNTKVDWLAPDPKPEIVERVLAKLEDMDAIQDSPCILLFREFDKAYPGSKFILTTRSTESWLNSYKKYFPDRNNPLRRWMYGVDWFSGNEAHYREKFEAMNADIIGYFADRPNDLLVMDLSKGDGWLELVNFLGKEHLKPFPHAKKSST